MKLIATFGGLIAIAIYCISLKAYIGAQLWYILKNGWPEPTKEDIQDGMRFLIANYLKDLRSGRKS